MQTTQTYTITYPGVSAQSQTEVVSEVIALLSDIQLANGLYASTISQATTFNAEFYNSFVFQFSMTGSGTSSFSLSSSVDGVNWVPLNTVAFTSVTQSQISVNGYVGQVKLNYVATGSTKPSGSAYVLAGR